MYYSGRYERKESQALRIAVFVLFTIFYFCWIYFFQGLMLGGMYEQVMTMVGGLTNHYSRLVIAVLLTVLLDIIALSIRILPFAKGSLYALDFLVPSLLIGAITGYDGQHFFTQSTAQWIAVGSISAVLLVVAVILKVKHIQRPIPGTFATAINLMYMTVLMSITAALGNTDETYHRELLVQQLIDNGQIDKALEVGKQETESSVKLDVLRTEAILKLGSDSTAMALGDRLFEYSISNPDYLKSYLQNKAIGDSLCHDNAMLVAALLARDLEKADTIVNPALYNKVMPKFIMQAMVITGNESVRKAFPTQYATESENYSKFQQEISTAQGKPEKYLKNMTLPDWHSTYFWYYRFP